jgi:DNA transformation protein and related proteins
MSRNRNLTDLKNIGKTIDGRLNGVGIFSEDDLKLVGAVGAHRMIKQRHPNETLAVCYYLYSFEGALTDKHWNELGEERKQQLKAQVGSQEAHSNRQK